MLRGDGIQDILDDHEDMLLSGSSYGQIDFATPKSFSRSQKHVLLGSVQPCYAAIWRSRISIKIDTCGEIYRVL